IRDLYVTGVQTCALPICHPTIGRATFWREDVKWFGPDGPVDFGPESRCLAYVLCGASVSDDDLYVMINAHWEDRLFKLQVENARSEERRVGKECRSRGSR